MVVVTKRPPSNHTPPMFRPHTHSHALQCCAALSLRHQLTTTTPTPRGTPPTQPPPPTKPSKASVPLVTTHTHTAQAQAPPADGHRLVIACVPHVCIDTVQSFCACCSLTTSMAQQQQRPPAPSVVCVPLAHLTIHHTTCHIRHPSCSGQHTRVVWVSMASHTVHTHAQTQTPHQTTNVQPCCLWV